MLNLRSLRNVLVITLLLVTQVCIPGRCQQVETSDVGEGDDDYDDEGGTDIECLPSEADTCFSDFNENLMCQVLSPKGRNCTQRGVRDFCVGLADALNCTSDIIDDNCNEAEGRFIFDHWLEGLRGVQAHLCQQGNDDLLTKFLKRNNCWNIRSFLRCVENKANVTHINDLLTTDLTGRECSLIQMAISICNDKAEKGRKQCRGQADAVNEAVAAFFTSSVCAGKKPTICNMPEPQPVKSPAESSSSSGMAIFLTLFITIILVALATLVLIWRNVIVVNFRFRRMRSGGNDDHDEGTGGGGHEDYGRFL